MRCLFITETVKKEQSRHRMLNYIHEKFGQNNIEFNILAFMESDDELILSDSGLIAPTECLGKSWYERGSLYKFYSTMRSYRPEILLIGGYGWMENWIALVYSIVNKIPVILWTGAGEQTTLSRSYVRVLLKRLFVSNIDTAVTYGSNATQYLIKLGMDPSKINQAVNVSNVDFFKKALAEYSDTEEMNSNLKGLSKPILVFVGKLELLKGVNLLIEQLKLIPQDKYFCYFIGAGNLSQAIQNSIDKKEINAQLLGYLTQAQIAKRLIESDVYILPSLNDPFSRTLSEALASGCFVLNSKYDDGSYDLIQEGENGHIFDPKDFDEFKYYMDMITDHRWSRPSRSEISKSLKYNMGDYGDNVINAVLKSIPTRA